MRRMRRMMRWDPEGSRRRKERRKKRRKGRLSSGEVEMRMRGMDGWAW